jgi:AraC-like DNA-binding protein
MNEADIRFFADLIKSTDQINTACYSSDGTRLFTNDTDDSVLLSAFSLLGCADAMLAYGKNHRMPITLGSPIGLEWAAAYEYQDEHLASCWVIGPFFFQEVSSQAIDQYLSSDQKFSVAFANRLREALKHVSFIPSIIGMRYTLMLHYSISHETIRMADINSEASQFKRPFAQTSIHHHERVWDTEQALLAMVKDGNLNYRQALTASQSISSGVPVIGREPLRQSKTSITVFTSLVTRVAIAGGLPADEAYTLGDMYINTAETLQDKGELDQLAVTMYDDFIHRVHNHHSLPNVSPKIQQCCDYIEMHFEEKISADTLAEATGYTKYYLSKRFKKETGLLINDYIRNVKIEQAKLLLEHSAMSMQEISDHLAFSSRNYFANVFHDATGMTPSEYRNSSKKAD